MDGRRTRHLEKKAQEVVSRHRPSKVDESRYYARKVAPVSASTGVRLGARQALGLCLHELTVGIFREVTDICRTACGRMKRATQTRCGSAPLLSRCLRHCSRSRGVHRDSAKRLPHGGSNRARGLGYSRRSCHCRSCFLLDQLDIFGVQGKRRRVFVVAELDARVERALATADAALGEAGL